MAGKVIVSVNYLDELRRRGNRPDVLRKEKRRILPKRNDVRSWRDKVRFPYAKRTRENQRFTGSGGLPGYSVCEKHRTQSPVTPRRRSIT